MLEWIAQVTSGKDLSDELSLLDRANRVIVRHKEITAKTIDDPASIRAVVALFQRHPKHWVAISGVFADYDFIFDHDGTALGTVGISKGYVGGSARVRINYGDYYQFVTEQEVDSLVANLGLKWPETR